MYIALVAVGFTLKATFHNVNTNMNVIYGIVRTASRLGLDRGMKKIRSVNVVTFKTFQTDTSVGDFMNSKTFEREINAPAREYYKKVYSLCTKTLTAKQKKLFDVWWDGKSIPSDECYWKNTAVPEGYEGFTPEDIKIAHDSVLYACSMGCG